MKILVVEDDLDIGNLLETLLKKQYEVIRAYSGTEAVLLLEREHVDLLLLDLMLPGISGEEVLTKVKGQVKVIILSAKSSIGDRVGNLLNGANDFISKPFDNDELLARIEVQLRDIEPKTEHISNGELRIEPEQRLAFVGKQQLKLTKIEYDILAFFMKHPNQVFSKNQIFEQVWDYNAIGNEESVKVHISNLRNKISIYTETKYIDTVWGIGFRFIPS